MLDALWDFGDAAASEVRFRDALDAAPPGTQAAGELCTQLARSLGLQGRFAQADAVLDDVAAGLDQDPAARPVLRARLALERGRVRNSGGAPDAAVPLFRDALDLAVGAGDGFLAADAAHMLAIADAAHAAEWTVRGLEIVGAAADPRAARWVGSLRNNLGWALHDAGRYAEALTQFQGAEEAYLATGTAEQARTSRWAVARCLRSLGRYEEALTIQTELAAGPSGGLVDEELGELLLALGRADQARPRFAAAVQKLRQDTDLVENQRDRIERLHTLAGLDRSNGNTLGSHDSGTTAPQ